MLHFLYTSLTVDIEIITWNINLIEFNGWKRVTEAFNSMGVHFEFIQNVELDSSSLLLWEVIACECSSTFRFLSVPASSSQSGGLSMWLPRQPSAGTLEQSQGLFCLLKDCCITASTTSSSSSLAIQTPHPPGGGPAVQTKYFCLSDARGCHSLAFAEASTFRCRQHLNHTAKSENRLQIIDGFVCSYNRKYVAVDAGLLLMFSLLTGQRLSGETEATSGCVVIKGPLGNFCLTSGSTCLYQSNQSGLLSIRFNVAVVLRADLDCVDFDKLLVLWMLSWLLLWEEYWVFCANLGGLECAFDQFGILWLLFEKIQSSDLIRTGKLLLLRSHAI